jgi:hypothetical protein
MFQGAFIIYGFGTGFALVAWFAESLDVVWLFKQRAVFGCGRI